MKKLPKIRFEPAVDWQRQRLARWVQEWEIDRRLPRWPTDQPPPPAETRLAAIYPDGRQRRSRAAAARSQPPPAPPDQAGQAGQIRLLYPASTVTRDRLLYLALLRQDSAGRFLVAPFGRFAEPALPGEWLTGRVPPPLRVLCLWNARVVSPRLLAASWLVDELGAGELEDALAVGQEAQTAGCLPARLQRQTGPPLVHPLDPRWQYQEQESTMMDELLAADLVASAGGGITRFRGTAELALAAEARAPYGAVPRWQLKRAALFLKVSVASDPSQRIITVVDARDQPSPKLDGSVLKTPDGVQSNPIVAAGLVVPAALLSAAAVVVTAEGLVFELEPRLL